MTKLNIEQCKQAKLTVFFPLHTICGQNMDCIYSKVKSQCPKHGLPT